MKQIPAFPLAYGVLMVADPPIIMMSAKRGDGQKGFRAGDRIGDFKIVNFDSRTIVLEWDGQKFTKSIQDLADRDAQTAALLNRPSAPVQESSPAAAPAAPATQVLSSSGGSPQGIGVDTGGGVRACVPGDSAAPGTITDGYRKVVSESPFGKVCRWEKVK